MPKNKTFERKFSDEPEGVTLAAAKMSLKSATSSQEIVRAVQTALNAPAIDIQIRPFLEHTRKAALELVELAVIVRIILLEAKWRKEEKISDMIGHLQHLQRHPELENVAWSTYPDCMEYVTLHEELDGKYEGETISEAHQKIKADALVRAIEKLTGLESTSIQQ
ncbi:hypothetical protein A3D88_03225 [Candidatus Peribacteria bacterium RIFCSPHIGHO2_02_FULL_52_16]|nr:MAG: hypothetical protein A2706_04045 [Candidatus Peribacteria bacterium RIFCSPHIGHO2_01_FULL_51_35]OGJ61344.1 MAG: hypothetical protein A3D88_03225 [Candidatus Peribacteria bacterium RIFCSPHIGHO2_02_FULL_52_16]